MTDDAFIITQLQTGEEDAFKFLFDSEYEKLCRFANCMVHDPTAAESIVDDVMLNIWENRNTLNVESSLHAYLIRAVRNRCINELKARLRRMASETTELKLNAETEMLEIVFRDDNEPIDELIGKELEEKINNAIATLPKECRTVLEKSRFEGLSYKEIADEMGISTNTVKYHIKKRTCLHAKKPRRLPEMDHHRHAYPMKGRKIKKKIHFSTTLFPLHVVY